MQELHSKAQLRTSSSAEQDPRGDARPTKRTRAVYRLRGIHKSFDRALLANALCTYFDIDKDGLTIQSLAFDAPYGRSSRQKVATITFQTTPEAIKVGNRWQVDIPLPQGESEGLNTVIFDTTFEGFTPLTAVEKEEETHTDCILVHGWAGHSIGSFSSPDGDWLWPRDGLSNDVSSLRVWLYGYSSDLRDTASIADVYEYADTFRRALTDARKPADPKLAARPLIFVVHSLGGWILQDAIIKMAASDHADDKINMSMVKGVLLFGVPNQGMESQQLISLLHEDDLPAVYTAGLLDERYGFRSRMNQTYDFYKVCSESNAVVFAFYETEKTPTVCRDIVTQRWTRNGPAALLVSQSSATYGCFERRNMIQWKSGHNTMLKLRKGDVHYETLLSRLHEILQRVESSQADRDKSSPLLSVQPKSTFSKYRVPFSIRGLPVAKSFIDRPIEMKFIEESLLPTASVNRRIIFVLRGLGGVGKTQLAIEFMRRHHEKFTAVLWLDGSSEDSLKRSIVRYADKISPRSGERDIDATVEEVLEWLAAMDNRSWLLVFDNIDREFDPTKSDPLAYDIESYLPDADHGSILITTRLARMEQFGESQEVKKVNNDIAQAIFRIWYKTPDDENDKEQLLEHLDGLPLAIAQAGAYLQESGTNIKTYIRFYGDEQKRIDEILRDSHVPLKEYPNRSVWTTWNISYTTILDQDQHVANLLILWSFLNRNDFWHGIFAEAVAASSIAKAFSQQIGSIASQESSFIKAMHLLRRYSLIEGSCSDSYSMHAVVHRWIYSYQGLKHQKDLGILALVLVGYAVPLSNERDYAQLQQRLLPHAQTSIARTLDSQAVAVQNTHSETHSMDWVDQQEYFLISINSLGNLYADQGKLAKAEEIYMRALQGYEEAFGAKHPSTLDTINDLGILYKNQGRFAEAEEMYMRVLQGREEALGPKHAWTLVTIHNLGNLYTDQGKYAKAEEMCMRALQGKEEAFGARHISTLATAHNLGNLYYEQGKLTEAEDMYMRALQGYEEAFGAEHTSTLDTINNLGNLYADRGELVKAKEMYMRALQGKEEAFGAKHTSTLNTISSLGVLYKNQGKLTEAEEMYMRALQGYEEALGAKHVSTLHAINNLAVLYKNQGKVAEAEKMFMRALKGYEEALGSKHKWTLSTMNNLGLLYTKQGKLTEAKDMYLQALQGYKEALGPKHKSTLDVINNLGLLHARQGKLAEAEQNGMRTILPLSAPALKVILRSPFEG